MNKKHSHHFKLIIAVTILAIFVLQTVTVTVLVHEHQQTRRKLSTVQSKLAYLQIASDASIVDEFMAPQINASEKRVYFPRLGLWLPMTAQTADMMYRVTDESGGGTMDATFTTRSNLELYRFDDTVDRCNELVRIEIGAAEAEAGIGEIDLTPIQLDDSTKAHIHYYAEGKDHCKQFVHSPQEIAQLLTEFKIY